MDEALVLLNSKIEHLLKLYQMSSNNTFEGKEEEVDCYAAYVAERQVLFEALQEIDAKLQLIEKNVSGLEQAVKIKKEIADISQKVYALEEVNAKNMQVVYQKAKDELHKIQNIKKFHYKRQQKAVFTQPSGFFIDKKK